MADSRSRRSAEAVTAYARWLERRASPGARLVVGLSGGRDSVALLHLAATHPRRSEYALSAVHVHHGLSAHADAWSAQCAALCGALDIPLRTERVTIARDAREGLEAAARAARYAVFARQDGDVLLLAHHADDQAETVLLNLLRGAGIAGLSGIPASRLLPRPVGAPLRLERPLLDCPRVAIDDYLDQHGLSYVDDESNGDLRHTRNFVRHAVMPVLAARFPGVTARLADAAAHCATGGQLLDDLAELDAQATRSDRGGLSVDRLRALSDERLANLVRYQLARRGVMPPSAARLREAVRQICRSREDCHLDLPFGPFALRVWRGRLHFVPLVNPPAIANWCGERSVPWGAGRIEFTPVVGAGLRADLVATSLCQLRTRSAGERFQPDGRRPRRALKDCFQMVGVPPWERAVAPLLWVGDQLAWVGGLGCAAGLQAAADAPGWRIDWLRE